MWFAGFPVAVVPLWQVAQDCVNPLWLNLAGSHDCAIWHEEQSVTVGIWLAGFNLAVLAPPRLWQPSQVFGVPLKTPLIWQLSHAVFECNPRSGNVVWSWLKLTLGRSPSAAIEEKEIRNPKHKARFRKTRQNLLLNNISPYNCAQTERSYNFWGLC